MSYGMDYQGDTGGGGGFGGSPGGGFGGGGGTSQSPGGGFNSGGGGGGGGGGARRSYDEQTVIPMTIKMALSAVPDEGAGMDAGGGSSSPAMMLEDGRPIVHVRIVGAVRTFNDNSTNTEYQLEDGTGGIVEVKLWHDEQQDSTGQTEIYRSTLQDAVYVKVVGKLRVYDNRTMIVAVSIRPLSTGNELAHHFLEVVYSAEKHKRGSSSGAVADAMITSPYKNVNNNGVGFGGAGNNDMKSKVPVQQMNGTGDNLRDTIMEYIKVHGEHNEIGANISACINDLTSTNKYTEDQIRHALSNLSAEGEIYSTTDEHHYKFASF